MVSISDDEGMHFGASSFTIALWIYPSELGWKRIFEKNNYPDEWFVLDIGSDGHIELDKGGEGIYGKSKSSAGLISTGSWAHVAVVCDRAPGREGNPVNTDFYYINGKLKAVDVWNTNFKNSLSIPGAGWNIGGPFNAIDADIDEFNIWNRALTATEIEGLFLTSRIICLNRTRRIYSGFVRVNQIPSIISRILNMPCPNQRI